MRLFHKDQKALTKAADAAAEHVEQRRTAAPAVDIYENDREILLIADFPGVTRDTVRVDFDHDQLTIEGRREEEPAANLLSSEVPPDDYRRSFSVPSGIDSDKIVAELDCGVLRVHLPKSESSRQRRIPVAAG